jgi:hypothetical protein
LVAHAAPFIATVFAGVTPVLAALLPVVAPIFAPFLPIFAPFFHPRGLSLGVRYRQNCGWRRRPHQLHSAQGE